jgi:hypothetical protein
VKILTGIKEMSQPVSFIEARTLAPIRSLSTFGRYPVLLCLPRAN